MGETGPHDVMEYATNAGRGMPTDLSDWHDCADRSCREGYDGERYYGPDTRLVRVRIAGRFASERYCLGCAGMIESYNARG